MHAGKLVFAQLMAHLPLHTFRQCVANYPCRYPTLTFSHLDQFLCLAFAQLTYRESLRDIETCLRAHQAKWASVDTSPRAHWPTPTNLAIGGVNSTSSLLDSGLPNFVASIRISRSVKSNWHANSIRKTALL